MKIRLSITGVGVSVVGLMVAALVILWAVSPFRAQAGFPYPVIKHTLMINAPAERVFGYLGNSTNAARWSVYVDHITALNPDRVPDGTIGSERRCFCQADEQGRQWDERLTEVVPSQRRQIICYNMVGFALTTEGLYTEQRYAPISANSCALTFTVFYKQQPTLWRQIKLRYTAFIIAEIFRRNMANIKTDVEAG